MAQAMQPLLVAGDEMKPANPGSPAGSSPHPVAPDLLLPGELAALLPAGTYQVEGLLGQGGMGAIYKGVQLRLHRPVAIKIMRRDQGRDFGFEQRFQREALAMAKLSHPNIVSVIDYGEAGLLYLYIVMELVDGADLMDVIRSGRMTQEMALTLLPQICDALQFAHDHGIIHRDIKPSNIMLTRDGRIKMADFGLAKGYDVESGFRTQSGTSMGTPDYAAPEQFIADAQIDHRADIYALVVMIYQMITGQLPRGVWKPPSQQVACDPHWDDIVDHAMQNDPKDRYQHVSEVKTDVSQIGQWNARAERSAGTRSKTRISLIIIIIIVAGAFFALRQLGALGQSVPPGQKAPPADIYSFGGHRYEFVPGAHAWDEAKKKAGEMGGHLVTITGKEEGEWIYATFGSRLDSTLRSSSIWLGASAEGSGRPFQWVTGEPFSYSDWNKDDPQYTSTIGKSVSGPFAISIKSRGQVLHWFDDPVGRANTNAGFIVEWDAK